MASPPRYRVHPAIGIARVGNAPVSDFYVGPERPGQPVTGVPGLGTTVPSFKSGGLVKRQAARFRIWEYVEKGGVWSPSREITLGEKDIVSLTWTVHVANRKASFFEFDGLAGSPLLPVQPSQTRRNYKVKDPRSLEIDPLPRDISGAGARKELRMGGSSNPAAELWPTPQPTPPIETLGELRTDDRGRLVVIPGAAMVGTRGGPITNYANNDGWFDDVCDGPVTAALRLRRAGGKVEKVVVQGAWLLVGPPDFAPDLPQTVSLYDLLFDLAARSIPLPKDESAYRSGELAHLTRIAKDLASGGMTLSTHKVDFDRDIAPILRQAVASSWVFEPAQFNHTNLGAGAGLAANWKMLSDPAQPKSLRSSIFSRLRRPGTPGIISGTGHDDDMPRLLGDDRSGVWGPSRLGLSLTITQYAMLERWAKGSFIGTKHGPASLLTPVVSGSITPHGLDRAALEGASGGAFYPGIEVGWQIREPSLFVEPFRIGHGTPSRYVGDSGVTVGAGYFSRQMALPWVADFLQCVTETQNNATPPQDWGWWPSQRPDAVYPNAAEAAKRGTMLPWHRASTGGSNSWPQDPTEPGGLGRPKEMPSYAQMLASWWKFGVLVNTPGKGFAESDRAGIVP